MITNNKIAALTLIGIVVGALVGLIVNTEQVNMFSLGVLGGIVGFLAGWVWNTRTTE
jgi:hypothetical protein